MSTSPGQMQLTRTPIVSRHGARQAVNLTTPASSLLLTKPNPAVNDGHPRKIASYTAYQTAVTNWINGEK